MSDVMCSPQAILKTRLVVKVTNVRALVFLDLSLLVFGLGYTWGCCSSRLLGGVMKHFFKG